MTSRFQCAVCGFSIDTTQLADGDLSTCPACSGTIWRGEDGPIRSVSRKLQERVLFPKIEVGSVLRSTKPMPVISAEVIATEAVPGRTGGEGGEVVTRKLKTDQRGTPIWPLQADQCSLDEETQPFPSHPVQATRERVSDENPVEVQEEPCPSPVETVVGGDRGTHPWLAVVLAALLGTPVAGGLLLAVNLRAAGRYRAARRTLSLAVMLATGEILSLAAVGRLSLLLVWMVVNGLLFAFLSVGLTRQVQRGGVQVGRRRSWLAALAWGVSTSIVTCTVAGLAGMLLVQFGLNPFERRIDERVTVGAQRVYYGAGVSEEEATRLAEYLDGRGEFQGYRTSEVAFMERGEELVIQFPSWQRSLGQWRQHQLVLHLRGLGTRVGADLFPGRAVRLELVDEQRRVVQSL